MTFWTDAIIVFLIGILANKLWNFFLYTGYSILILKQIQQDSVKLMSTAAQTVAEIQMIKYLEMQKSGKSEKEIEIQQSVDEYYMKPIKNAMINNYIATFPKRYEHLLEFYDWNSAMEYVDQLIKKER